MEPRPRLSNKLPLPSSFLSACCMPLLGKLPGATRKAPQPVFQSSCECPAFALEPWMYLPITEIEGLISADVLDLSCFQKPLPFKARVTPLRSAARRLSLQLPGHLFGIISFPPPSPQLCSRHVGLFTLPQTDRAYSHLPNQWPTLLFLQVSTQVCPLEGAKSDHPVSNCPNLCPPMTFSSAPCSLFHSMLNTYYANSFLHTHLHFTPN